MTHVKFHAPERVAKPWGYELIWAKTEQYVGKILHIAVGQALSYQYHRVKNETVYLQSGLMEIELEEEGVRVAYRMQPGEAFHIPAGTKHRMRALQECEVIEVSTTELDDIIRLEDLYGRL